MNNIRNILRLLFIATVLARYGVLFFWRSGAKINGTRLRRAIETLGPSFVKLGQMLSTRADLIGDELAASLSDLQDKIPPFPTATARAIIESELGKPISILFASFDNHPAAAASIAQVHFARTHDGEDVAVKILRPNIERAFARDLKLFYWLAAAIEKRAPHYRRLKPTQVVDTLESWVDFELDLRYEAAASDELRTNLKNDTGFYIPKPYWLLSSRRVLVSERIFGMQISDVASIKAAGIDPNAVLRKAAISFFNQVFRDGYFHADLHPGNLFVQMNGDIAAVDFGIMGRLDKQTRIYLALILRGFLKEDYLALAKVHIDAGYVPRGTDAAQFAQSLMAIARPIMGKKISDISIAQLLGQLFRNAETFKMEVQPQLLLLQKTMMVAEGVGRMLNPDVNMWMIAEPLAEAWAHQNLRPSARLREIISELPRHLQNFPDLLKKADEALTLYIKERKDCA